VGMGRGSLGIRPARSRRGRPLVSPSTTLDHSKNQRCGAIEGDGRRDQGAALGVMESEGCGGTGWGAQARVEGRGVSGGLRGERRTPSETNCAHAARGSPAPARLPPTEALPPPPPPPPPPLRPESVEPHRPPLRLPSVTLGRPTLLCLGRLRVTDGKRRGGAPPRLAFPIPREPCPPGRAVTPPNSGPQLRGGGGTSSGCSHEVAGRRAASPDGVGSPAPTAAPGHDRVQ
jgi:hypothetical protein